MAFEPVNIYLKDSQKLPTPGVLVRIYSADGAQVFTEATSGADGKVSFLLSDQGYSMRFYKYQCSFRMPQLFSVVTDPATPGATANEFDVVVSSMERQGSNDVRLCRCSGNFRDVTGAPRGQLDIQFIGVFTPTIIDGSLFIDERRTLKTEHNGFGCIDLVRGACYLVTLEGFEDQQLYIRVPDESSANLPDVLFPIVKSISTTPAAVSVAAGQSQTLVPIVVDSVNIPYEGTARQQVTWSVEDSTVAAVTVGASEITIQGLKAGSTTITAKRRNAAVVKVPDLPILGVPIAITVS